MSFVLTIVFCCCIGLLQAQNPVYFQQTTEEGLPSNEVYAIAKDKKGYLWFGTDEGLFRYNGQRFVPYRNKQQSSRPTSGLFFSASGRLYCYNFKGQIFYLEKDSLFELKHSLEFVYNINTNEHCKGLYVGHKDGVSFYDEGKKAWILYQTADHLPKISHVRNPVFDKNNKVWFYDNKGIGTIYPQEKMSYKEHPAVDDEIPGAFIMTGLDNAVLLFSFVGGKVYRADEQRVVPFESKVLGDLLKYRKVTAVRPLKDGYIWICSYTGVIRYDLAKDKADVFYPDFAISDCIIDEENNYWFSTLQNGILRVPNLNYLLYNSSNKSLPKEKIHKLAVIGDTLFFSSSDGLIASIHQHSLEVNTYDNQTAADIQCLKAVAGKLYYVVHDKVYELSNGKNRFVCVNAYPLRSILKYETEYIIGSAIGAYVFDKIEAPKELYRLTDSRVRDLELVNNKLWIASNKGLVLFKKDVKGQWKEERIFLKDVQISALDYDPNNQLLYLLDFNGNCFYINTKLELLKLGKIPDNLQGYQLVQHRAKLYLATAKGLWIYDLTAKTWSNFDKQSGLASNNLKDIYVTDSFIWLATNKGLQRIHTQTNFLKPPPKMLPPSILVGNRVYTSNENILLRYNQEVIVYPEAISYSSNSSFRYAYRLRHENRSWNYFPASIEQINIAGIPPGNFELEIKAIDRLGRDSDTIVLLKGYVQAPYWQQWWFYLLMVLISAAFAFLIIRYQIGKLRAKQAREIRRIQLENELRATRETALKAQMNPHFLFNVLNSIKGYIYENDKKSAVNYLNRFSDLIRKVLELSATPKVKLSAELELLKAYIDLEAMLLQQDFSYEVHIDETLDSEHLKIPALLLQPFVENAFKHGLRHKKGHKRLDISIQPDAENFILIQIQDNGIGRAAANAINNASPVRHQSFGSSATEKRVALLNQESVGSIFVEIIDLEDEHRVASGTLVKLKIRTDESY